MADEPKPRFILEFDGPEALALFVMNRQPGDAAELPPKVLVNDLPQTFKIKAEVGVHEGRQAIILHICSRTLADGDGVITVGPGERQVV